MIATAARARRWRVGAAVVTVYLVAATVTFAWATRRHLALYEGVGIPANYQWVHPPPQFAASNAKPLSSDTDIAFSLGSTPPAVTSTPDAQCIINFSPGSVTARGTDTGVHVAMTPLDPATLGLPPAGLVADGNAYRVQLTYRPSGVPIDTVAASGQVVMLAPYPVHTLLFSPDGRVWTALASKLVGGPSATGAAFAHAGYYLAASRAGVVPGTRRTGLGTVLIAVLAAALAVVLVAVPVSVRAWRRRRADRRAKPSGTRPRPPGTRGR